MLSLCYAVDLGLIWQCASKLYPDMKKDGEGAADSDDEEEDIESAIKKELADNKDKKKKDTRSIASVKIDTMCGACAPLLAFPPPQNTDRV